MVSALVLLNEYKERATLIGSHGQNQKRLNNGIDLIITFFKKGKKKCYQNLEENSGAQEALATLGDTWQLSENTISIIQQSLCHPYISFKKVEAVRYEFFLKNVNSLDKKVDMLTMASRKKAYIFFVQFLCSVIEKSDLK